MRGTACEVSGFRRIFVRLVVSSKPQGKKKQIQNKKVCRSSHSVGQVHSQRHGRQHGDLVLVCHQHRSMYVVVIHRSESPGQNCVKASRGAGLVGISLWMRYAEK